MLSVLDDPKFGGHFVEGVKLWGIPGPKRSVVRIQIDPDWLNIDTIHGEIALSIDVLGVQHLLSSISLCIFKPEVQWHSEFCPSPCEFSAKASEVKLPRNKVNACITWTSEPIIKEVFEFQFWKFSQNDTFKLFPFGGFTFGMTSNPFLAAIEQIVSAN